MSNYLQRLIARYRPDSTTAFVPNANHYASRGAELEADPAILEPVGDPRAPDTEPTSGAREEAHRSPAADLSDPGPGRSQAMAAAAPVTMPPTAAAVRAAVSPVHAEVSGTAAQAADVRDVPVGSGSSSAGDTTDPARVEARSVRGMAPGPGDREARATLEAPLPTADRDGIVGMVAPAPVPAPFPAPFPAPVPAPSPLPLPQAPDLASPGAHQLPTGDARRPPSTRSDPPAATLLAPVVDRTVGQALADGAAGAASADQPRTAHGGDAAGSWPSHRQSTASVPASAPSGRIQLPASEEDGTRAGRLAPETSSPPADTRLPRTAPSLSLPLPPRAIGGATTEVRGASRQGDGSMTPVDARLATPVAEAASQHVAGAAPERRTGREPTRSSPIGLAGERGRDAAVRPVRSAAEPARRAVGSANLQSAAPAPASEPAAKDEGRPFKAPIVPARAPEPPRLPTAAAVAPTVSITIGSVEFRAPPAAAPAPAARVAAVAAPRLTLDDYLRQRRGRQT